MANNKPRQEPQFSDIIAKAATKGKFLDFRNNLILADPNEYAMLHGIGGGKHAPKSTIRILITDYNAGAGHSVVVTANVTPELIPYLFEVCKKNVTVATPQQSKEDELSKAVSELLLMGTALPAQNGNPQFLAVPVAAVQKLPEKQGYNAQSQEVYHTMQREAIPLQPDARTGAQYVGVPKGRLEEMLRTVQAQAETSAPGGVNYTYRQERVNVYRQENGLVPVSVLNITREGTRKSGEVSRMPWTVKIQNFMAKPSPQRNGTTSYISSSRQKVTEAFVQLSDYDMFRCLYRVSRFIEIWEVNYGTGLITEGLRRREAQRSANRQQGETYTGGGAEVPSDDGFDYEDY